MSKAASKGATPGFRIEHDSMGELQGPADALWGAQTQRAVQNFPVSGQRMPRGFIRALGLVKGAAAGVHAELGHLPKTVAKAIQIAAAEVAAGDWDAHFPIDVYQTGGQDHGASQRPRQPGAELQRRDPDRAARVGGAGGA
ncbi:hypothetical protein G6F32_015404 [Rhizopus arrhizus]|nr:hypothetical protein G6F32_015404 [Rhizopus arrhizus]